MQIASDVAVVLLVAVPVVLWPATVAWSWNVATIEILLAGVAGAVLAAHFVPAVGGWSTTAVVAYAVSVPTLAVVGIVRHGGRRGAQSRRFVIARSVGGVYVVIAVLGTAAGLAVGLLGVLSGPDESQVRLPEGVHIAGIGTEDCGSSACSVELTLATDATSDDLARAVANLDGSCARFGPWALGEVCFTAEDRDTLLARYSDWL